MRKYLLFITGVAAIILLLSQATVAQTKKVKPKMDDNDEIIIKRKSDKDAKVTIEIKGDEVIVNGKPVDDYDGDDIIVRKRKSGTVLYRSASPFRQGQGSTFSYNGDGFNIAGGNIAFLGVVTERSERGAKIEEVTDESAAEKAGLKKGDIITNIDESKIEDADDVTKAIRKHKPEEKATITYLRDGKENKITVTLGKRKGTTVYGLNDLHAPMDIMPNMDFKMPDLNWKDGGFGQTFAYGGRPRLGIQAQDTEDGKGVKVLNVDDESAAEKAGIKEGDVITEFDGKKIDSADDLAKASRESKEKIAIKVSYTRDGKAQSTEIKIPRKLRTTNL